jgi:hypothetical protein
VELDGEPEEGGPLRSIKPLILSLKIMPITPALSMICLGSHFYLMFKHRDKVEKSDPVKQSCSMIMTEPKG